MRVIIAEKPHIAPMRAAGSLCTVTQPVNCNRPWTYLVSHSVRHQKIVFLSNVGNGETRYPRVTFCLSRKLARMRLKFIKSLQNLKKNQFPDFQVFLNPIETVVEPGA